MDLRADNNGFGKERNGAPFRLELEQWTCGQITTDLERNGTAHR